MPTAGWILEGARDRFLYGTTTVPDPGPPPAPIFPCPFCHATFPTKAGLLRHSNDQHLGSRPFILLGGAEPSSTEIIRKAFRSADVSLINATEIYLSFDGSSFEKRDTVSVVRTLAEHRNLRIWLRLENHFLANAAPIRTDYDLSFRIYSKEILEQVDKLFVACLGRADPSVHNVDQFLQKSRSIGANEYADALGDYVLGVLIKDGDPRAGIRPGDRDYRRRYNSALRTLQEFDRPLAQLVSGLIRFSSNHFGTSQETCFKPLDICNVWLTSLAGRLHAPSRPISADFEEDVGRIEVCPIDNGSAAVVSEAGYLSSCRRWSTDIEARMSGVVGLAMLDPLDRVKLLALWADTAIRLGQPQGALSALRKLVGNDCFGAWAVSKLEEYER